MLSLGRFVSVRCLTQTLHDAQKQRRNEVNDGRK